MPTLRLVEAGNPEPANADAAHIEDWLGNATSPNTQDAYRRDVLAFWAFCQQRPWASLQVRDVLAWRDSMDAAPNTVRRRLAAVKSVCTYMHNVGHLTINFAAVVKLPAAPNELAQRILPRDDIGRMIDAARCARDKALLMLGATCGVRADEFGGLQWRALTGTTLAVFGKGGRTRHIGVDPITMAALNALRDASTPADQPIFIGRQGPQGLCRSMVGRIVKKAAIDAGLSPAVSAHWLRHFFGTEALAQPGAQLAAVSRAMGHASPTTTMGYVHINPTSMVPGFG